MAPDSRINAAKVVVENHKVIPYTLYMRYAALTKKKLALDRLRPLPPALVKNLDDWYRVELTFTSNAIEGNTLSRRETAVVIENGLTVGGKSLREHLEATNHAKALDLVRALATKTPATVTEADILSLHQMILRGIDDPNAGRYRSVPVRIAGARVALPNPRKVPELMAEFMAWLSGPHDEHPVALAGEAHFLLVSIHPFTDGNGRAARLLMNLLLLMHGYPPAIIRKEDRLAYLGALETAQLGGAREPYDKLIAKAAERSLDIYLNAAMGKDEVAPRREDRLLKIGEVAKAAGVTVPTIRHWTNEGLLTVAELTASGYQLYAPEMIARCQEIHNLKAQRLTLAEIRERLSA